MYGQCAVPGNPRNVVDVAAGLYHSVAIMDNCQPDFDNDGVVQGADLGALLGAWGSTTVQVQFDLDRDGSVGGSDLGILLGMWGVCLE
jgi:hypothetical protein